MFIYICEVGFIIYSAQNSYIDLQCRVSLWPFPCPSFFPIWHTIHDFHNSRDTVLSFIELVLLMPWTMEFWKHYVPDSKQKGLTRRQKKKEHRGNAVEEEPGWGSWYLSRWYNPPLSTFRGSQTASGNGSNRTQSYVCTFKENYVLF